MGALRVGGGGESDGGLSCSSPSTLRSPSVKCRRGETEDNFVRRNVREQWCLLLDTWTMWKKVKSDGILCLCCEIWWTCPHLTPTTGWRRCFQPSCGPALHWGNYECIFRCRLLDQIYPPKRITEPLHAAFFSLRVYCCVLHAQFKSHFIRHAFSPPHTSVLPRLTHSPREPRFSIWISIIMLVLWLDFSPPGIRPLCSSPSHSLPLPLQSPPIWWIAHIITEVIEYADRCWLLACGVGVPGVAVSDKGLW